jgi:LytS/YehU family sensor histidine kinase
MNRIKQKKYSLKSVLIAAFISIAIGTTFLTVGSGTFRIPFVHYLWNAGYSLFLGMGLFANGLLYRKVENRYITWIKHPVKSLLIALFAHLSYSTVVIVLTNWLYFIVYRGLSLDQFLQFGSPIIIGQYIALIIISSIIYAKSFFKEYRNEAIQSERLKQEAILLQYQVLQNQVNPHFLFNSLNILGSLIDIDHHKAKQFIRELSKFYRDLLTFKEKELIPLSEEIDFIKRYIYLQKIRFGDNFEVNILLKDDIKGEVIPMSIQMMVENAVKHNIVSKDQPLKVIIGKLEGDRLFVENNIQKKENIDGSNKIGLKNLQHRYKYLTNEEMEIESNNRFFRVTFPLVIIEQ